ncbi:peptidylprolyl isomerase [Nocardioides coralli]|uniref:peptidylprolyl isomerase n=1 Tax=Nocardioides coralli TaxID=2872154 RepID=UPI001CA3E32B|nr:peptidylprolyl isomerase [Nocardioides coralli]QZY27703.1 peptidylprolyl isomerase [Nocardioides coralli]
MPTRLLALPATLLLALALAACSDSGDDTAADPAAEDAPQESFTGETTQCSYTDTGSAARDVEQPPTEAQAEGEVPVTLSTSVGDVSVTLDAAGAPCTVNSFVSLVEQGYYDDTQCHRLTTQGIFVLQCGDPTATGTGGPGYSFGDEVAEDASYGAGTLAMANAGPDTNGSQFFIVYEDTQLPPAYTVFGSVSGESLEVVQEVAADGTESGAPDGPPSTEVTIEAAAVG